MKQMIENPNEVDWVGFWKEMLKDKKDKDWDKAAVGFYKRSKKDDYQNALFSKLILNENDTVLDLGCGEGSITIPLAKKVKKVIGYDSSSKMLEFLEKRAKNKNINNIETIQKTIEDLKYDEIGDVDVVVASRSLNGIIPIDEVLSEINKIANKYVFITLFGPENQKMEKEFDESIGKKRTNFPAHDYFFNILYNMGIYANIERLNLNVYREYDNLEEAMDNGKFNLDLYSDEEKELLREYLDNLLSVNPKNGKLYYTKDKPDWILIWWEK